MARLDRHSYDMAQFWHQFPAYCVLLASVDNDESGPG